MRDGFSLDDIAPEVWAFLWAEPDHTRNHLTFPREHLALAMVSEEYRQAVRESVVRTAQLVARHGLPAGLDDGEDDGLSGWFS
ncbi:hypothetical protein [Kitasatospora viridis]|uniref:Uncharacterized protein n=1 Tax=Kitasatospora viridis TaxID=281105 RepID=A0A561TTF4_9ACTN|nr:hypothetical protein [Kitasatospora viridis]TWF90393.1 hypothetical protein FHX73_13437 [Kitasatospora viridis]